MKRKNLIIIFLIIIIPFILFFCKSNNLRLQSNYNKMLVHYFDVGQGDSILIQVNNRNLLIDSGPKTSRKKLLTSLKQLNINRIDYLIATHPHEDHIGNMSSIIRQFDIGRFYSPKVQSTTKSFESMVEALKSKNLKINILKAGLSSIDLGENTEISVFSPINDSSKENLNNYSPAILIKFGENKFLFTGDAEKEVENEILSQNSNVKSDVLKLGHHGSSSSTSEAFLKAVNPSIGVISAGTDNPYGHPHKETLALLNSNKIKIFRTDKDGTITLSSDGKNICKVKK
ncbi:ComEC/Rec2 family competence protein [Clostridium sp. HBUAS56017]|uniref:ComEC/Rec2 family competence protein n=1 Tax=Clostridium sp. HBUAS56017 TaxID=2571128 RepID=UPI0011780AA4|nr:ComEC/Rec2 family competence protein [Clostridium sp. HBUAS56017]